MSRPSCRRLPGIVYAAIFMAQAHAATLTQYESTITKLDAFHATVSSRIMITPPAAATSFLIRTDGKEQIENLAVQDGLGSAVQPHILNSDAGMRLQIASGRSWTISYNVHASPFPLTRIPLPVPSIPAAPESKLVHLTLHTPPGEVAYGSLFPGIHWKSQSDGDSVLLGVPAFVILPSKPPAEIPITAKLFTVDNLANCSMLFLVAVALYRLLLYLKKSNRAGKRQEV